MTEGDIKNQLNIPESNRPRVVIVGGGFTGLNLARRLAGNGYQLVLIDRNNHHTFQPLLYQVATAGLEPDSIAGPLRSFTGNTTDLKFRMLEVAGADLHNSTLHTSGGSISYDILVLAPGAKTHYFANRAIEQNAFPLKDIHQALRLRSHIFEQFERAMLHSDPTRQEAHLNFVIAGGGPTGVELAGALAELRDHVISHDYPKQFADRMKIYLVEGKDRILPMMSEKSGKKTRKYLEKMGVRIITESIITNYENHTVSLNDGSAIEAHTLVWAAGVRPAEINGMENLPRRAGGRILVNRKGQIFRSEPPAEQDNSQSIEDRVYENAYALGDVACMPTPQYPDGVPGMAQAAIQQGRFLAKNLRRKKHNKSLRLFEYNNKGVLATIGRNRAVADLPGNTHLAGAAGWLIWSFVHILYLVGFRSRMIVFINWVWNYFSYDRAVRLIFRYGDCSEDHGKKKNSSTTASR